MGDDEGNAPDGLEAIKKLLPLASQLKLGKGVVAKIVPVVWVSILVLGAIALKTQNPWLEGAIVAAIIVLCPVLMFKTLSYAERNPGIALLEGGELITFQREFGRESKARPVSVPVDQLPLIEIPAEDVTQIEPSPVPEGGQP